MYQKHTMNQQVIQYQSKVYFEHKSVFPFFEEDGYRQ